MIACPSCGTSNTAGSQFCGSCGSQLGGASTAGGAVAAGAPPVGVAYAGFWIRFVAWIIDALILIIPNIIIQVVSRRTRSRIGIPDRPWRHLRHRVLGDGRRHTREDGNGSQGYDRRRSAARVRSGGPALHRLHSICDHPLHRVHHDCFQFREARASRPDRRYDRRQDARHREASQWPQRAVFAAETRS